MCINGIVSEQFKLDYGVPHGSCLRPVEFTEYSSPVFSIVYQHGKLRHAYVDDHQVYCNRESMERCISDINTWMQGMKLKLNHSKTEYILSGTPRQIAKCTNILINT